MLYDVEGNVRMPLFKNVRVYYWGEIPQGFSKDTLLFFRIDCYAVRYCDGEFDYKKITGADNATTVDREEVRNYMELKNTKLGSLL